MSTEKILSNLRFADDVALLNETTKQMEKHMNNLNSESMKVGLKIHKGKTKYMTNHADSEDILIDQQKIEKVTEFKYLGQTTHLKDTTKEEIYARIRAAWSCFGKNKEILQDNQLPISLKKQVMDQCILPTMTYGCQTWSLNKQMTNKLRTAQRAMERKMLDLKLKDKIPCAEIRKRTKIIDIIEYTLKQKWKWASHIARLKDNRWTRRCTEWQPRRGKRSRGRPSRRWQDDITEKEGTTWIRKATDRRRWKTLMEGYILQWMDKAWMRWDEKDSHISSTLADATHFYCPLSIFKPPVYQLVCRTYVSGKHMWLRTHTLSLSLSFCVYVAGYVCIRVRPRQRVWSVWTVAGLSLICFGSDFFFSGNSPILSQFDFCGYWCWSVIRINNLIK